jgi:hypothetical protein
MGIEGMVVNSKVYPVQSPCQRLIKFLSPLYEFQCPRVLGFAPSQTSELKLIWGFGLFLTLLLDLEYLFCLVQRVLVNKRPERQCEQFEQLHISLTRCNAARNEKSAHAGGIVLSPSDSGHNQ